MRNLILSISVLCSSIAYCQTYNTWESSPGSPNVIYVQMNGGTGYQNASISAVPTEAERLVIYNAIVEDFYIFNVNVTTNPTVFNNTPNSNRVGIIVGQGARGAAWSTFGAAGTYQVDAPDAFTAIHELGHAFSLKHDGVNPTGGSGYLEGVGNWSPILGLQNTIVNGQTVVTKINHWYNGYKDNTHNQENDIEKIASKLGYKADDYSSVYPLKIESNGTILSSNNVGGIQGNDDHDSFYFITNGGNVTLEIQPNNIEYPNLIVQAILKNEQGGTVKVGTVNGYLDMGNSITVSNLPQGKYTLEIDGVGMDGVCSDYSSFGPYLITGTIQNHVAVNATDLTLASMSTSDLCTSSFTPEITLFNSGTVDISTFTAKIYLDQVLHSSTTINTTINTAQTVQVNLPEIAFEGEKEIEIVISNPNGTTDFNLDDNTISRTVELRKGDAYQVQLDAFYIDPNLEWSITNSSFTEIASNISFDLKFDGTYNSTSTDFCLTTDCYSIEISNLFQNIGTCNYPIHSSGGTYNANDMVLFLSGGQYKIYKAKWWTTAAPGSDSAWEFIGNCDKNESTDWFRIIKKNDASEFFKITAAEMNGSVDQQECIGNITSLNTIKDAEIKIYPNPTQGLISWNEKKSFKIMNATGSLVSDGSDTQYDLSNLPKGIYFVKMDNLIQKIIKH